MYIEHSTVGSFEFQSRRRHAIERRSEGEPNVDNLSEDKAKAGAFEIDEGHHYRNENVAVHRTSTSPNDDASSVDEATEVITKEGSA